MLHARGTVIRTETPADVFWRMLTLATDTAGYTVQSIETYGDRRERERETETETETETDRQTDRHRHRHRDRDRETDRDRQTETERDRQRDTQTDRQTETDRDFIYRRGVDLKTVYIQPLPMREYLDQRDRQTDRN